MNIKQEDAFTLCKRFLDVYTDTVTKGQIQILEEENADGVVKDLLCQVKERHRRDFLQSHTTLMGGIRKLLISEGHTEPVTDLQRTKVTVLIEQWAPKQMNPHFFTVLDIAYRIAGIGSLGVERYAILVEGKGSPDKNYLLDFKAELPSSLQPYLKLPQPQWSNQAERAVSIQQWVQGIPPALLAAVEMDDTAYVLRELQPTEDKVELGPLAGKVKHLAQLVGTIANVVAWGQSRSAGHQSVAPAYDLMSFVQQSAWRHNLLNYAQSYAKDVEIDYQEFCSAFDRGAFSA